MDKKAVSAVRPGKPLPMKRRLNRRRVRRAALTLSFLLLTALGAYFVLRSSLFTVRSVVIQGNAQVSSDELQALSGVKTGENIWNVDLSRVQAAIATDPWVKAASVSRRLPGTLLITISERTPVALIPYRTTYVELDASGVAVDISDSLINRDLPLITGQIVTSVILGHTVDAQGVMGGIRAVLPLAPETIAQISEVNVAADGSLTMILLNKVRVYLGQPDQTLEKRVGMLQSILDDVARQGKAIDYIDLRYNGNPVTGVGNEVGPQ